MKRLLISVTFLLTGAGLVFAGGGRKAGVPVSQTGQTLATFDYGGVDYATATVARSTSNVLLFAGEGVVYGFFLSSAAAADYVLFRATNSLSPGQTNDNLVTNEAFRVLVTSGQATQTRIFAPPVRFKRGCTARLAETVVQSITYLFHSFE